MHGVTSDIVSTQGKFSKRKKQGQQRLRINNGCACKVSSRKYIESDKKKQESDKDRKVVTEEGCYEGVCSVCTF